MNQLSTKLKKTREARNLNRSQIAMMLGISSQLYGQYEDGKRMPKTPFFIKWKEKFKEDLIETYVSRGAETDHVTEVNEPSAKYGSTGIDDLAHSNRILAETNQKMANAILDRLAILDYVKANLDNLPGSMNLLTKILLEGQEKNLEVLSKKIDRLKNPGSLVAPDAKDKRQVPKEKRSQKS